MPKTGGNVLLREADNHRMERVLNNWTAPVMPLRHQEIGTAAGPREGEELGASGVEIEWL